MESLKQKNAQNRRSTNIIVLVLTAVCRYSLKTICQHTTRLVTDLALDRNEDPRVRLNFNITMMDLRCDFAVVDVVSVLGTDQNVTAHVTKWDIDAEGVRRRYKGRNRQQKDIQLFDETVSESLEDLHENGEDAISFDADTLEFAKRENDYLFVDFYASWCSHCRALAPTWEALAEVMSDVAEHIVRENNEDYSEEDYEAAKKVELPVMIGKVDCVIHKDVCNQQQKIRAYPTLRLFVDGEPWKGGDYKGHRTLVEIAEWLQHVEEQHKEQIGADEDARKLHLAHEGKFLYSGAAIRMRLGWQVCSSCFTHAVRSIAVATGILLSLLLQQPHAND